MKIAILHAARRCTPALLLLAALAPSVLAARTAAKPLSTNLPLAPRAADTLASGRLIQPHTLARQIAGPAATRPMLLHVGFESLYRGGHIPGSRYAGPGGKPEGLAALRAALRGVPQSRPIVLYCGCCPWHHCPNVRPAYRVAREMGYQNVKVLYVTENLQTDWIDQGLPITRGER